MKNIVGIDLGTSTSEVAIFRDGKPFVIPNLDGDIITPSVIGLDDNGNVIVGRQARDQMLFKPKDTILEVKRLMGSNSKIRLGSKEITPQEASSYIIKYLIKSASEYLEETIESAVISVPAYFSDEQRKATVEAGKLAGITVERIINEPTSASLDYGLDHMKESQHVLIYDLGGGTLDVTVLEMFEGVLEVKSSSGDNKLGGKDFDTLLIDYLVRKFSEIHGEDISSEPRAMLRLKVAVEECKIALSTQESFTISLPFIATVKDNPVSLEEVFTREMFESLIRGKVEATENPINIALKDANLTKNEIDIVLLVGGSTRIPLVQKFVAGVIGQEPKDLLDPDLAVVRGACVQGAILTGELSSDTDIMITDVCPYTLGISTCISLGDSFIPGFFSPIIHRNTTIPCSRQEEYFPLMPYQTTVEIEVFQGDNHIAMENNFLNKFLLDGIPAAPAGKEKFTVNFTYDVNGILDVTAVVQSTQKSATITIETTGVSMEEEIDLENWKESPKARKYRAIVNKAMRIIENEESGSCEFELIDATNQLKKALIKDKDEDILDNLKSIVSDILLDILEEEDE
jgi:molecular chaperone DnaK